MELVAHRAGNTVAAIAPTVAAAVADALELDLHLLHNRIEVRHAKAVWPFRLYWERDPLHLVRDLDPPTLDDIVDRCDADVHLWLDLKVASPRLAWRALAATAGRPDRTASTRFWYTLRPFRRAGVRTFRSVGNRWQLWLASRLRYGPTDGIVMHERFADADVMVRLLARTDQVVVWAVRDLDRAVELDRLGVTGIIADELDLLASIRARLG